MGLAALLFFFRLGGRALWAAEGRWVEIAREMVLRRDYFWPTINGQLYYDKPLLSYWLVITAAQLTGAVNELAGRIPSALMALVAVALLILLARRLDRRPFVPALAGLIAATSYTFVVYARAAAADMHTVTGVLAAVTLYSYRRDRPKGWWVVGLWLIMAVASLTKGLQGFAVPLFVLGLDSLLGDGLAALKQELGGAGLGRIGLTLIRRMGWLFNSKTPLAIAAAVLVYCAPFWISKAQTHSNAGLYMVFRENVVRFFHPFDHRGPIYLYVIDIFALMAPWSVFLPGALTAAHAALSDGDLRDARNRRSALIYFWGVFIFFTISRSRRSYYLLPIVPAGALLIAQALLTAPSEIYRPARRLIQVAFIVLGVTAIVGGALLLLPAGARPGRLTLLPATPDRLLLFVCYAAVVAALVFSVRRRLSEASLSLAACLIAYLFFFYLNGALLPAAENYRSERPFAQQVRQQLAGPDGHLGFYKVWGPGLVFYLDQPQPIPSFYDAAAAALFLRQTGGHYLIVREKDLPELGGDPTVVTREPRFSWQGHGDRRGIYLLVRRHEAALNQ